MTKRRWFLLGILCGQLLALPTIHTLIKVPRLVAYIVTSRDNDFTTTAPKNFVIHSVPDWTGTARDLKIHVVPVKTVIEANRLITQQTTPTLLGFYDVRRHEIWTINSTEVLVHEITHIFEKDFHK